MKIDVISPIFDPLALLLEANIINVKEEYNGTSIATYLKQFVDNLPQNLQQPFLKKLSTFLVNDERFHYAVRELPANAPEWAQKAVAARQLFAFKPTETLTDTLTHITHYLSAAAEDAKESPSPDVRVTAQRELAGFVKAENLDILKKSSDEYFKTGSRKDSRDVAGSVKVFDAGGGYIWYKLVDEEAFRREGTVLQNCIGRIWTKSRAEREEMIICVLKTGEGDSVVAMRIHEKTKEFHELKGKNNQPPIEKYMLPCIKFINHMKLKPHAYARGDLHQAGYYYDNESNTLMSKAQAIKHFVKAVPIAEIGQGLTLVRVDVKDHDLFADLYQHLIHGLYYYGSDPEELNDVKVYELRTKDSTPIVGAYVKGSELEQVTVYPRGVDIVKESEAPRKDSLFVLMVRSLVDNKLISHFGKEVKQHLEWFEDVDVDPSIDKDQAPEKRSDLIRKRTDSETLEVEKTPLSWRVITNDARVKRIVDEVENQSTLSFSSEKHLSALRTKTVDRVYLEQFKKSNDPTESERYVHVLLHTTDGYLLPVRVSPSRWQLKVSSAQVGFDTINTYQRGSRNEGVVNSLVGVANKTNSKLPKTVQMNHGIIQDNNGKYQPFRPKFEPTEGNTPGSKLDLSKLTPEERLIALVYITTNKKYVDVTVGNRSGVFSLISAINAFGRGGDESVIKTRLKNKTEYFDDLEDWSTRKLEKLYDKFFAGEVPTAVYVTDIKYGSDQKSRATMVVSGKKIIRLDDNTTAANWQTWDDHERVAQQLNTFAKDNGLSFHDGAVIPIHKQMSTSKHQGELRVRNGELVTAEYVRKQDIEKRRASGRYQTEGTDDLSFADGTKIQRMTPDEQALWSRAEAQGAGAKGEAWKLLDPTGEPIAIFLISSSKLFQGMYTKDDKGLFSVRGIKASLLPQIKTAANTFKWDVNTSRALQIQPGSLMHQTLAKFKHATRRNHGVKPLVRALKAAGLVSISARQRQGWVDVSITPKGRQAIRDLDLQQSVNLITDVQPVELPAGYTPPQKAKPTVQPKQSNVQQPLSAPRTGTKADQALARFREIVTDTGNIPSRGEFIRLLMQEPFNMSAAGAQTYYYTTKAKYAALGESLSALAAKELREDKTMQSLRSFLISFG